MHKVSLAESQLAGRFIEGLQEDLLKAAIMPRRDSDQSADPSCSLAQVPRTMRAISPGVWLQTQALTLKFVTRTQALSPLATGLPHATALQQPPLTPAAFGRSGLKGGWAPSRSIGEEVLRIC